MLYGHVASWQKKNQFSSLLANFPPPLVLMPMCKGAFVSCVLFPHESTVVTLSTETVHPPHRDWEWSLTVWNGMTCPHSFQLQLGHLMSHESLCDTRPAVSSDSWLTAALADPYEALMSSVKDVRPLESWLIGNILFPHQVEVLSRVDFKYFLRLPLSVVNTNTRQHVVFWVSLPVFLNITHWRLTCCCTEQNNMCGTAGATRMATIMHAGWCTKQCY